MIVPLSVIIVSVDHSEMAPQLLDQSLEIARQKGVAGVQAGTDFGRVDGVKNPEDVAGVPKKEMRQLVFEGAH